MAPSRGGGAGASHPRRVDYRLELDNLVYRLCNILCIRPDDAWELTLPDALGVSRHAEKLLGKAALMFGLASTLPWAGKKGAREIMQTFEAMGRGRPRTLAEEFGPEVAREMEELNRRNLAKAKAAQSRRPLV